MHAAPDGTSVATNLIVLGHAAFGAWVQELAARLGTHAWKQRTVLSTRAFSAVNTIISKPVVLTVRRKSYF